ncbi:MAG TPA: hypothetical protein VG755_29330, partial [Nannocystaceae bacterium]|nr:hypothetical protein [Nannocystaceae bacterium]
MSVQGIVAATVPASTEPSAGSDASASERAFASVLASVAGDAPTETIAVVDAANDASVAVPTFDIVAPSLDLAAAPTRFAQGAATPRFADLPPPPVDDASAPSCDVIVPIDDAFTPSSDGVAPIDEASAPIPETSAPSFDAVAPTVDAFAPVSDPLAPSVDPIAATTIAPAPVEVIPVDPAAAAPRVAAHVETRVDSDAREVSVAELELARSEHGDAPIPAKAPMYDAIQQPKSPAPQPAAARPEPASRSDFADALAARSAEEPERDPSPESIAPPALELAPPRDPIAPVRAPITIDEPDASAADDHEPSEPRTTTTAAAPTPAPPTITPTHESPAKPVADASRTAAATIDPIAAPRA